MPSPVLGRIPREKLSFRINSPGINLYDVTTKWYKMNQKIHFPSIYPSDKAKPANAEVFYRELMKKHEGKIPVNQRSEREFRCDLFLYDVKIRAKLKEFIAVASAKEKVYNLFS